MTHEYEGCPCCGADAVPVSAAMEEAIGALLGAALDAKVTVDCQLRFECDCWRRVGCTTCVRCAKHCECVAEQVRQASTRKFFRGMNAQEAKARQTTFGFELPKKERKKKGAKR